MAVLRRLPQRGSRSADPDLRNENGQSPLTGAAFKGYADVVAALLESGANAAARDASGNSALDVAHAMGAVEAVARLVQLGGGKAA